MREIYAVFICAVHIRCMCTPDVRRIYGVYTPYSNALSMPHAYLYMRPIIAGYGYVYTYIYIYIFVSIYLVVAADSAKRHALYRLCKHGHIRQPMPHGIFY